MTFKIHKWLVVVFAIVCLQANAEILKPVKWSYSCKKITENTYDLIMDAHVDKGWHLYSQHIGDNGPIPTSFHFETDPAVTLVGEVKEKGKAIKIHDPNFDNMEVIYFKDDAIFVQRIRTSKPVIEINGSLEFMVCNDHVCLPPETKKFTIDLTKSIAEPVVKQKNPTSEPSMTIGQTTKVDPVTWTFDIKNIKGNEYQLLLTARIIRGWFLNAQNINGKNNFKAPAVSLGSDSFKVTDFLLSQSKTVNFTISDASSHAGYDSVAVFSQKVTVVKKSKKLNGTISFNACNEKECLSAKQVSFSIDVPKEKVVTELEGNKPLSTIFLLCFFGGFAALLTPCVYPMIPLTVSFFTKHNEKKSSGVASAMLFGASIILIYVGLGLLITLVFGRNGLNNLASNVYTNLAFFVVFLIFAFSFLGAFEIALPSSWANKSDSRAEKGGVIGIFFIALTLTIVSFSCTSPVIGPLVYFAASGGGYAGPAIGMMGFALAWALPFTFFAMFPALMQKLPKSGGWLNSVKVTFGFLELALALKFLSTADLTYNWGLLKREYFLALWIIIFGLLGLYLLGKLKLSHDTPMGHISVTRLMLAILSLSFALYMVPGLWGAPVRLLSGIAPPSSYSEWIHEEPGQKADASLLAKTDNTDKPHKYHDLFKSPHGIKAYYDYDEALAAAKAAHKPLMLDFTGHACTNCRLMEENVWSNPTALAMLKNDYVLVSLYADDRTALPVNEQFISKYSGDKIEDIGDKWKDLETGRYNTNALPFYVLLDNNENMIGKYDGYDPDADKFLAFLSNGKSEFLKTATASVN